MRRRSLALAVSLAAAPACRCNPEPAPLPPPAPTDVVDFHTHIALGSGARADEVFTKAGISVAVRLSGRPAGERLRALIAESKAMRTQTLVFAGVPWQLVDDPHFGDLAADSLRAAVAMGARGLKISKVLGVGVRTADDELLPVDAPRLDPLWSAAGELGVPVAIHTGDPLAFFEPMDAHNERLAELSAHPSWSFYGGDYPGLRELLAARDRMVARHPETTFVAVHVGGLAEDLDAVAASMRALPNLWIDIAARLPEIGRHPPAQVRGFFEEFQDRILFGTDLQVSRHGLVLGSAGDPEHLPRKAEAALRYYAVHWRYLETNDQHIPHVTPIQGRWTIDAIGLGPGILAKVYRQNARRLLHLE